MAECYEFIRAQVENRFKTQWAIVGEGIPIQFDSGPIVLADGTPPPVNYKTGKYVRISLVFADSVQKSIGRTYEQSQPGAVYVNLFWPSGEGTSPAMKLCDKIAPIFRRYRMVQDGKTLDFKMPSGPVITTGEKVAATVVTNFDCRFQQSVS